MKTALLFPAIALVAFTFSAAAALAYPHETKADQIQDGVEGHEFSRNEYGPDRMSEQPEGEVFIIASPCGAYPIRMPC